MQIYVNMNADKLIGKINTHDARMQRAIARWQDVAGGVLLKETQGEAPVKRGILRDSLYVQASGTSVKVATKLPYAKYVVNGTRAHTIRPVGSKALRFRIGSRVIFAKSVRHPGTKPNRFLQRALDNKRIFIKSLLSQFVTQEINRG